MCGLASFWKVWGLDKKFSGWKGLLKSLIEAERIPSTTEAVMQ
jgi:hypothetical protein